MIKLNHVLPIILFALFFCSCTSDNVNEYYGELECRSENITFQETIQPIIDSNCAVAGCHITGTGLPSWESYENIATNAEEIALRTQIGQMPPASSGKSLTLKEVQQIQCWVNSGAPDN